MKNVVPIAIFSLFVQAAAFSSDAVAEAYLEQGNLLLKRGQLEAAYKIFLKADLHLQELSSKGLYGDKVYEGTLHANLGECARRLANSPAYRSQRPAMLALSEKHLADALRIKEQAYGTDAIEIAKVLEDLGTTFYDNEKLAEAEAVFRKAIKIREHNEGANSCSLYYSLYKLGQIHTHSGSPTNEAETCYQRSLAISTSCFGANDARVGKLHQEIAYRAYLQGKQGTALDHYDKAMGIFKRNAGETKQNIEECKKIFEALVQDSYVNALKQYEKQLSSNPTAGPELIPYIKKLIVASRRLDQPKDVEYLTELAKQLSKRRLNKNG